MLILPTNIQISQDASFKERDMVRSLCHACDTENNEKINEILKKNMNIINLGQYRVGMPPLCIAIQKGFLSVVKDLLKFGAGINIATRKAYLGFPMHATPLWFAAQGEDRKIIRVILEGGGISNPVLEGEAKEKVEEEQKKILEETQKKLSSACLIILESKNSKSIFNKVPYDVIRVILKIFNELPL
jgi:hypothetical protein